VNAPEKKRRPDSEGRAGERTRRETQNIVRMKSGRASGTGGGIKDEKNKAEPTSQGKRRRGGKK